MTDLPHPIRTHRVTARMGAVGLLAAAALSLAACTASPADGPTSGESGGGTDVIADPETPPEGGADPEPEPEPEPDEREDATAESEEPPTVATQDETCDWDAPKLSGPAETPTGQDGELAEVLVGSWQHTHTDEGSGFEAVSTDHRFVFPSPDRLLYCQHVPGVTEHAENAANVTLNGTTIELPGGEYGYTVTAWSENAMVWDNPVGGGYVYLLQRR